MPDQHLVETNELLHEINMLLNDDHEDDQQDPFLMEIYNKVYLVSLQCITGYFQVQHEERFQIIKEYHESLNEEYNVTEHMKNVGAQGFVPNYFFHHFSDFLKEACFDPIYIQHGCNCINPTNTEVICFYKFFYFT